MLSRRTAQHGTVNSCPHTVPLEEMATHLNDEVLGPLAQIVVAFNEPSEPRLASAASSASSGHADDSQVTELRKKVEDAFIFSCPNCAANAQEHDACCSVTCGNKGCNSNFCSLCFKNFAPGAAGSTDSHRHVREQHTGESAFEYRYDEFDELDANHHKTRWSYEKRYQWLLTRKKLDSILTAEVKPGVKEKLLQSIQKTYQGDYELMMWPMPVGHSTPEWLTHVLADVKMPTKKKIWFLQNEAVFLREKGEKASASLVDQEVQKLGGKLIVSLDASRGGNRAQAADINRNVTAVVEDPAHPEMTALYRDLRDNRPQLFALGGAAGQIYRITDPEGRVPPFVLSAEPKNADGTPRKMTHFEAVSWDEDTRTKKDAQPGIPPEFLKHHTGYCESIGERSATEEELHAIVRAATIPGRGFNRDAIAGCQELLFGRQ